jgi:hypothetical protein
MSQSREELIRANFEVHRDLHWATTLEPRFREYELDPDAMRHYREAWNVFAEDRDWSWWKEESRRYSNDELKSETAECLEELKVVEARRPGRKRADLGPQSLADILGDALQPSTELVHSLTKTQER